MEKLTRCVIYHDTVTYGIESYRVFRYNIWHKIWKGFGFIAGNCTKEAAIEQAKKMLHGKIKLIEIVDI